jgi:hypothetical protein
MEAVAFFERKIGLSPRDLNKLKGTTVDELIMTKLREGLEEKCSEHGFVLPGSLKLISRSMGYYEHARFSGDAMYYVKSSGSVLYPADGIRVIGEVIRKNKLGLYVVHRDALRIQVPRDLHIGNEEFDKVEIGDKVEVELKKSRFQINDAFILTNGIFIKRSGEVAEVAEVTDKVAAEEVAEVADKVAAEEVAEVAEVAEVTEVAEVADEGDSAIGVETEEDADEDGDKVIGVAEDDEEETDEEEKSTESA